MRAKKISQRIKIYKWLHKWHYWTEN